MAENYTLGQKIKMFRTQAGMSQLELELSIDAAQGSLSRIESGKVNPTKETLIKIAEALHLDENQVGSLFQIPTDSTIQAISIISSFTQFLDLDKVLQTAVNEISEKLNYISVAIFILEGKELHAKFLNQNNASIAGMKVIGKKFPELWVDETTGADNLLLKAALEAKSFIDNGLIPFGRGAIPTPILKVVQQITMMRRGIAMPLIFNGESFGSMYFTKPNRQEYYKEELDLLTALTNQIAITIKNIEHIQTYLTQYGQNAGTKN